VNDSRRTGPPSSPLADDEGVRVLPKVGASRFGIETRLFAGVATVVGAAVAASLWWPAADATRTARAVDVPAGVASPTPESPRASASAPAPPQGPAERVALHLGTTLDTAPRDGPTPSGDPDDLASYFRPGDPVPSTANLIRALNEAGVHTGIAAFNPPGTSPPLEGLAVPADFALPPGYVRHHQVTDEGVSIEPILMFSPDLVLRDADGRPIALPENRVVPPELAPPGLPQRWVRPNGP
jgi:hypothetical protein